MEITTVAIKELRERTSAGILDCKKALTEAKGDIEAACEILKQRGLAIAAKKAQRVTQEGLIEGYIHNNSRIGAIVEVNCETDFVARTKEFKELCRNLAMQIAAMNPLYISPDDFKQGSDEEPSQVCLLSQPFIKDPSKTVQDIVTETVAKVGENIRIRRFTRFELGN